MKSFLTKFEASLGYMQPRLHREFKSSLGYGRPCCKEGTQWQFLCEALCVLKENTNIRKFAEDCRAPVGLIRDCKLEDASGSELRAGVQARFLAALGLGFVALWFCSSQLSVIYLFEELAMEENACIFHHPPTFSLHPTLPLEGMPGC